MHGLEFRKIEIAAHRGKIQCLSARHAHRAAGIRQNLNHLQASIETHAGRSIAGQQRECQDLQRIADEDGGRFIEGAMRRGLAAAQVVIVHRRQIVVNQRIRVNEFHRRSRRIQCIRVQPKGFSGAIDEQRAQALAAAQDRVALRRVEALWNHVGRRKYRVEDGAHARLIAAQPRFQGFGAHGLCSAGFGFVGSEVFKSGFAGFFEQDLYFLFRLFERGLAGTRQHHPTLERRQRFLERQVALLEAGHQIFKVAHGRLEVGFCFFFGFGCRHSSERYTGAAAGSNPGGRPKWGRCRYRHPVPARNIAKS